MGEHEPQTADSETSATTGWKVGDKALTKLHDGGWLYATPEVAAHLGITEGVDGWTAAEVVDDPLPGSDWIYVEEGAEYTPEQAARKFLSLDWDAQVQRMERFLDDSGAAAACHMLNHEGAHIFATRHTCHDRYQEGWQDALKELERTLGLSS